MASFDSLFQKDRDIIRETGAQPGNLLQVNTAGTDLVPYDLVSGTGATEIITETTVTSTLAYSTHSFATAGTTASSTLTLTSTGVDLTGMFAAGDLVYFEGNFSGASATTYGTSTTGFLFAFPIATITAPATLPETNAWTIVLNLNIAPFAAWQEGSTVALVMAETGTTITETGATAAFFTAAVTATTGLTVSLRTSTTVSTVEISQYADGDLEIAGINADGVVVNLTQGDFGTAGQAVLVNSTGDGLVFGSAGVTNNTSQSLIPYWDGNSFENSGLYIGYLATLSDSGGTGVSQMDFDSSTAATTVTMTLSSNISPDNFELNDVIHFGIFSTGIPGFGGTVHQYLAGRVGTITTLTSQTSFVVTFVGDPINTGTTSVSGFFSYDFIVTGGNHTSPLFIDAATRIQGDFSTEANWQITLPFNMNAQLNNGSWNVNTNFGVNLNGSTDGSGGSISANSGGVSIGSGSGTNTQVTLSGKIQQDISTVNADGSTASTAGYTFVIVPSGTTITTPLANTIYLHLES